MKSTPPLARPMPETISELLALFQIFCSVKKMAEWLAIIPRRFYKRILTPRLTLWCMIFQRLFPDKTLEAVVEYLSQGGCDSLTEEGREPISSRIRSTSTASFSDSRQRLPLELIQMVFRETADPLTPTTWSGSTLDWLGDRPVQLVDGSTIALHPYGDIPEQVPPAENQHGPGYWCLVRVLTGFLLRDGRVLSFAHDSMRVSEQAMCDRLFAQCCPRTIHVGDRNFGVFHVIERARHNQQDILVRMTASRARKLLGKQKLSSGKECEVLWSPSRSDKLAENADPTPIDGRLIFVCLHRKGHRPIKLWLFTTLMDSTVFTIERLVELYGFRWHAELNFRHLKSQLKLETLDVRSMAMVRKELYVALIAYNLVRRVMAAAAAQKGLASYELSFCRCLRAMLSAFRRLSSATGPVNEQTMIRELTDLIVRMGMYRLPKRRKARCSEPRRVRYRARTFPSLVGDRQLARQALYAKMAKS